MVTIPTFRHHNPRRAAMQGLPQALRANASVAHSPQAHRRTALSSRSGQGQPLVEDFMRRGSAPCGSGGSAGPRSAPESCPPSASPRCAPTARRSACGERSKPHGGGLGPPVPIAAVSPVVGNLAADRGRTTAQLIDDLADRVASGHQCLDLASFIAGQLAAAFAHDCSPWFIVWRLSSACWPSAAC